MPRDRFTYKCTDCGREYDSGKTIYLCPSCSGGNTIGAPPSGVLNVIYDYTRVRRKNPGFDDLKKSAFTDLLPISSVDSLPPLHVGNTPLYAMNTVARVPVNFRLHLKDDSQ